VKLHFITIGEPKLEFAKLGWQEYFKRLGRFHSVRVTHLADKYAEDEKAILKAAGESSKVALVIDGEQMSSKKLADFLRARAVEGRELSLIIGGPDGLPKDVIVNADFRWSLSQLTFPHDLAMVFTLEALYRASTINAKHPYHRA
jgi:23S rRNA (pseudouridine1915-N3)-methyltransferase